MAKTTVRKTVDIQQWLSNLETDWDDPSDNLTRRVAISSYDQDQHQKCITMTPLGEDNLQDPGDKARHKESNKPQVEESETADSTSQQLP